MITDAAIRHGAGRILDLDDRDQQLVLEHRQVVGPQGVACLPSRVGSHRPPVAPAGAVDHLRLEGGLGRRQGARPAQHPVGGAAGNHGFEVTLVLLPADRFQELAVGVVEGDLSHRDRAVLAVDKALLGLALHQGLENRVHRRLGVFGLGPEPGRLANAPHAGAIDEHRFGPTGRAHRSPVRASGRAGADGEGGAKARRLDFHELPRTPDGQARRIGGRAQLKTANPWAGCARAAGRYRVSGSHPMERRR